MNENKSHDIATCGDPNFDVICIRHNVHPASLILFLIKKNAYSNAVFYSIDLIHYTSMYCGMKPSKIHLKVFSNEIIQSRKKYGKIR